MRPVKARVNAVVEKLGLTRARRWVCRRTRLGAAEKGRPQLGGGGAGGKDGLDVRPAHQSTRGDQRQRHRGPHLSERGEQWQRAGARCQCGIVRKGTSMGSGLGTLDAQRIGPRSLGVDRLGRGRHGDDDKAAGTAQPSHVVRRWATEGEAHDRDSFGLEQVQLGAVVVVVPSRLAQRDAHAIRQWSQPEPVAVERPPVHRRLTRHEHVDAEQSGGAAAHLAYLPPHLVCRPVTRGQEPQPAGLADSDDQLRCGRTAGHRCGDDRHAQPEALAEPAIG